MADILSNSVSGLLAVQRALTTTGQNVSNANTEGYSRQTVNMSARDPQFVGNGYVGTGTQVQSITRSFDQFVESQLRDATSDSSRLTFVSDFASQVTGVLGDSESGISQATGAFFDAAGDVAANPTDTTARNAFLNEAEALAGRFNQMDSQLAKLDDGVGRQASSMAGEVNTLASEVAELNGKITTATQQNPNSPPNDLLDRRDQLVKEIADRIDIRVDDDGKGGLNLAVGSGQALVTGNTSNELSARNSPAGLSIEISGRDITSRVAGGQLGGMIEAQSTLITPLRNELGRVAATMAQEVNAVQEAGVDLNGDDGKPLFTDIGDFQPAVSSDRGNSGNGEATGEITEAKQLQDTRYVARFDGGSNEWVIRDERDPGTTIARVDPGTTDNPTSEIPGLSLTFSGNPEGGDALYIDPAVGAAGQIRTQLSDPDEVAAAVEGSGAGSRDNTNIEALSRLADQNLVGQDDADEGGESLGGALTSAVTGAGAVARNAEQQGESSRSALESLQARRESVSGVNLDEEAAKLLQYQQQYQALARSISVSGDLFQSVLNAVR
ncbi:flagellar hook-associated protein FlgK [Guyparkeria sp.]|uniref:flagellar hook-associated protein FlgK n=1 Tax=Guyparkeria sp. TaxID=2035736 RepID=UPI0039707E90